MLEAVAQQYDLVVVRTVEEALEHLRKHNFDGVISGTADFLPLERAVGSQQSAALLHTLSQGVCVIDTSGRILWQNNSMAAFGPGLHEQV